ncbi:MULTISPECIES: type II toxin-antitoxin system toxin DNA ADP-ribosyl transferase DarT [Alcaligenes]|jgi:hypothetical protein|uniref:type II toxin-antitoxin system toxin DNA ADP-ribosyl transferase DarT n=1 Tax=Alcaligenes TaxID=507 RepID=UPI001EF0F59D|nr:DUF4433 domain-containing protein [Alcaligenes faecalis]ULH07750.1 DUF4433 domain-containing protein [Alcaligenes faecalis]
MAYDYSKTLNPQKALIWRIVHRDNIPWILGNNLHCGNSSAQATSWVTIGNTELIGKRGEREVPIAPGGVLNDYIPFYFTPFSPMMINIHSGRGGVQRRPNEEIVILVSDLHRISAQKIPFVYTDKHAYYGWANFYTDIQHLHNIDWKILQTRDFRRDPNDLEKFERYQAEALIHQMLPVSALLGMICYTDDTKTTIERWLQKQKINIPVHTRPGWYF